MPYDETIIKFQNCTRCQICGHVLDITTCQVYKCKMIDSVAAKLMGVNVLLPGKNWLLPSTVHNLNKV